MLLSKCKALLGILLAGSLILVGCTKPDKKEASGDDQKNATFRVESGEATGWADPILASDKWQKPLSTTFKFVACVVDRSRDARLLNHEFSVEKTATKETVETLKTNPNGCLIWTETIMFNYFAARSRWVTVERTLVGRGVNTGRRVVTFAVNPWLAASRQEMNPSQAGYFLRDEPLELKEPEKRFEKVYEFLLSMLLKAKKGSDELSASDLETLKTQLKSDLAKDFKKGDSVLVPSTEAASVLDGFSEGAAQLWIPEVQLLNVKSRNIGFDPDLEKQCVKPKFKDSEICKSRADQGYLIEQTIQMSPRLIIKQANGTVAYEDIVQGDFDIYITMLGTNVGANQDEKLILSQNVNRVNISEADEKLVRNMPQGSGRVIDGKLIAFVKFRVARAVAEGNLQAAIRLVPRSLANRAPKEFESIYNFGDITSWVGGGKSGILDQACVPGLGDVAGCSISKVLEKTTNFSNLVAQKRAYTADPYFSSNVRARFVQVAAGKTLINSDGKLEVDVGETATSRTVLYSVSICLTTQSGDRMPRQNFTIEYLDTSDTGGWTAPITKQANDEGCLFWTNTIKHGYYKPERFFRQQVAITGPGGARLLKTFYINPWDDKFTFGFDEVDLGREYFEGENSRPRIPSRFFMGEYAYHTVRFLYEIDPNMDLEVKKTVLMDLQPQVLRYSGIISGRKVTEPLRDGIYLLKVGIQKSYLDPADRMRKFCEADRKRTKQDPTTGDYSEVIEKVTVADSELCSLTRDKRSVVTDSNGSGGVGGKVRENVVTKEFISTKTTLVRVTDGLIVHPVELSMKDLRLMRIRSNFLIQLETVDERKVLANHVLNQQYKSLIEESLNERRLEAEALRKKLIDENKNSEDKLKEESKKVEEALLARAEARRTYIRDSYIKELQRLNVNTNMVDDFFRENEDKDKLVSDLSKSPEELTELLERMSPAQKEDFLRIKDRYDLYKKMAINDFTSVSLPSCDLVACDQFIDSDSGIEKRTFVGPVIFLSNSYKDAMRATDNLDEANCHSEIEGVDYDLADLDPFETMMKDFQKDLFGQSDSKLMPDPAVKTNNSYRYSKYFNSLRHFCVREKPPERPGARSKTEFYPKQVDDLIREEADLKLDYQIKVKALATPYYFASIYNLDFYSMGNEALRKVDEAKVANHCLNVAMDDCKSEESRRDPRCVEKRLETACTVETKEHQTTTERLIAQAERSFPKHPLLSDSESDIEALRDAVYEPIKIPGPPQPVKVVQKDLEQAFFGDQFSGRPHVVNCSILASQVGENFRKLIPSATQDDQASLERLLVYRCMAKGRHGVSRDKKLRVFETGNYVFMGGMQLNFNVGSSFGISHSASTSAGVDYFDATNLAITTSGALAGAASSWWSAAAGAAATTGAAGATVGGVPGAVVGAGLGALVATALKPFDFKQSKSMGESAGTSISEGTYLVGQVAKFSIPLKRWEQCSVLRLHPELVQEFGRQMGIGTYQSPPVLSVEYLGSWVDTLNPVNWIGSIRRRLLDGVEDKPREAARRLNDIFQHGVFACDGVKRTKDVLADGREVEGKDIEELYFYFTQHFTEGDMLDQADLYNHPWLLSLRGWRDFSSFVATIRGQEVPGIRKFVDGLTGERPALDVPGWPLEQLANTYKAVLPSFPGLFTVLDPSEGMNYFPMDQKKFQRIDLDVNAEVDRWNASRLDPNR